MQIFRAKKYAIFPFFSAFFPPDLPIVPVFLKSFTVSQLKNAPSAVMLPLQST